MLNMIAGQKTKVSDIHPTSQPLQVSLEFGAGFELDFSCFGLDSSGKLSDERYMTFFNQPQTPCGAVQISSNAHNKTRFQIDLPRLPQSIDKLVLTASIDGSHTMAQIQHGILQINDPSPTAEFRLQPQHFNAEKALMVAEFYRKDGIWRFAAVGQGFNGGLAALVTFFGGDVADDSAAPTPAAQPSPTLSPAANNIDLVKKMQHAAPQLVDLAKKASVVLDKHQLGQVKAQVGLVLDASGSMNGQYSKGRVQEVIERLLPLAVHFDDDGALECWAFAEKTAQLDSVSMSNIRDYVETNNKGWKKWPVGGRFNEEPKAIEQVINFYQQHATRGVPVYILFISDGGIGALNSRKIKSLITDAAKLPIFWQFVGIGGSKYGILEELDDLEGRVVDNCDFFALDDLHDVDAQTLYDKMLTEFPQWLNAVKNKGIL